MTLDRKDAGATAVALLVVLAFAAAHQGWNVWLVGDSNRSAAVVITVLGVVGCALGSPSRDRASLLLGVLGTATGVLAAIAIATGSLTALSFLTLAVVLLWLGSLVRHARRGHTPAPV